MKTPNSAPQNRVREHKNRGRAPYYLWNSLLAPLVPALGVYTLWRRFGQKKSAASLRGQWGNLPSEAISTLHADKSSTRIWIHAVSVGETLAARPVARALRQAIPNCVIALSTTTDSGQETAQIAKNAGEVDAVFYFPLDVSFAVQRAINAVRPHVFLAMETELWPNFLHLAHKSGAKTFLVNGRVSDNLLRRAPKMGGLWRWMMTNLDGFLMRNSGDAERIVSLGAPVSRVVVTGDVKLDALNTVQNIAEIRAQWRRVLEIADDAPFLVAGSTHAGEEEKVIAAFAKLRTEFPTARLLIAPRHIERVPEIVEKIENLGEKVVRRSEINASQIEYSNFADAANPLSQSAILVLDTVGELSQIYAAADVAFVGGSLIPRGGHNVLEPVLCGVAVAFGPHIANFRDAAALVERADCGQIINDESELAALWTRWLHEKTWRNEVAERAENVLREHRGASLRVAKIVAQSLQNADFEYSKSENAPQNEAGIS